VNILEKQSGPYLEALTTYKSLVFDPQSKEQREFRLYPGEQVSDLERARELLRDAPGAFRQLRALPASEPEKAALWERERSLRNELAAAVSELEAAQAGFLKRRAELAGRVERRIAALADHRAGMRSRDVEPRVEWPTVPGVPGVPALPAPAVPAEKAGKK